MYSQKDEKDSNFYKEFEKEIRERGSKEPLTNVHFRHFYLTSEKKLFTLAMMERAKKDEPSEESHEKGELSNLPPLLLALTIDQNNGDLNEEELAEIVQIRLPEQLSEYSFKLLENDRNIYFKKMNINDILDSYKETLKKEPGSIIFLTSLKGEIGPISSRIWKGMTRMYLSFSAYSSKGKLIWKKIIETKFLDKRKPITLSTSDRQMNYNKTLKKGFREIENKGILKEFKKVF